MHNADLPEDMQRPIYDDHGTSMRWKIQVFREYKYLFLIALYCVANCILDTF